MAAAALNFRDVMVALNMLPTAAYEHSALGCEVGIEGSGTVRRVGAGVRRFRPGDEVVFTAGGCIANRVVVHQHTVFPKPSTLSHDSRGVGVVRVHDVVLRLAAPGPSSRGAKGTHPFRHGGGRTVCHRPWPSMSGRKFTRRPATTKKGSKLRALGVKEVFDSHSYDWYDQLMDSTGGEGVDVVLNSLSGRHVALCLEALRPGGWHCEIGKVDVYADTGLNMFVFRKNLRFRRDRRRPSGAGGPRIAPRNVPGLPGFVRTGGGAAVACHSVPLSRSTRMPCG